ncbi:MAG: hypothetical protein HPY55_13915 [Firmicutes bacterium]|nr:hypothetical protein [Bacillota bacterium]
MHYSREEWRRFRLNRVTPEGREAMADHLAACESCLDAYISTIETRDEELAEVLLDPSFVDGVMRQVRATRRTPTEIPERRLAFSPLQNYAMAAAVTAMLLCVGWFDAFPRVIHLTMEETVRAPADAKLQLPVSWVSEFTDRLSGYITGLTRCGGQSRDPVKGDGLTE